MPCYLTDLTEAEWAIVAPRIPAAKPGGRPRTTDLREVVNAIFYVLRSGCQRRRLPWAPIAATVVAHWSAERAVTATTAPAGSGRLHAVVIWSLGRPHRMAASSCQLRACHLHGAPSPANI